MPSRAGEFFKGFFWPALFGALGLCTYPLFLAYDEAHNVSNRGSEAAPAAAVFAFAGAVALVFRWWRPLRWRAYGVMAGLLGAGPLLVVALLAAVIIFKIPILPH